MLFLWFQGMKSCQNVLIAMSGIFTIQVPAGGGRPVITAYRQLQRCDVAKLYDRQHN